jgi:hypothetical protein
MPKYTSTYARNQNEKFRAAVLGMQEAALKRCRLVIKTSADDEVRVSFIKPQRPFGSPGGEAAQAPDQACETSFLDYKQKSRYLDAANENRQGNQPVRQGSKGITKYGRRTTREGCAVIQERFAREVAFVTLTIPGSTKEALATVAENAPEMLDAFFQRVRWHLKTRKSSIDEITYAGVWELQKRGALHVHVAIGLNDAGMLAELEKNHRRWWCQILETYSSKTGVDLFARADGGTWRKRWRKVQTDCQKIRKSCKRYMSKYISKGTTDGASLDGAAPKRWWFMSRNLKQEVLARRVSHVLMYDDFEECVKDAGALMEAVRGETQKTFAMENPFSGEVVGYQMYFEEGAKSAVYETLCALLFTEIGAETLQKIRSEIERPPDKGEQLLAA